MQPEKKGTGVRRREVWGVQSRKNKGLFAEAVVVLQRPKATPLSTLSNRDGGEKEREAREIGERREPAMTLRTSEFPLPDAQQCAP